MSVIRVNPASVQKYGADAQARFGDIHQRLVELVNSVATVRYFGPNAESFKLKTAELAQSFAVNTHTKMSQIADAVKTSTSNISNALGGQPISIQVVSSPVTIPTITKADYVDVDVTALSELKGTVSDKFGLINAAFDANRTALANTDWQGQARESAVGAVNTITEAAKSAALSALEGINKAIQSQIEAVNAADK